ncbi:competence protein ComEC [Microlunatus panaciterrae]|uniref:Competence protein ComEC n=1 Tax=Microlunatus panaciterrae TaxID=400768 RepID=A0ABS2RGZ7_9ACTN|nr:competence protein ComEC [Microlunatus panaciterrae]
MALATWAATWLGTSGWSSAAPLVGLASLLVVIIACLRRSSRLTALAVLLATGLAVGMLQTYRVSGSLVRQLATAGAVVSAEVAISGDPHRQAGAAGQPDFLMVRAVLVEIKARGETWRVRSPVLLMVAGTEVDDWARIPVGSRLQIKGRLRPPNAGDDLAAVVRIRGPSVVVAAPGRGLRWVEHVREGLRRSVAERSPEQRALVPALVLGDTSGISTTMRTEFQDTGLTHLMAVSGANLTLLLAFLMLLARWLGVRGRWLRFVGLSGVFVFVALCRTEPSVLRAAAMGLVALAALGSGGAQKGLRSLAAAMVVLLLLDPWLSRSIGFALSVLASGGIVWWAGRWAAMLQRWLPRIIAEAVAVPLAAHLATLPLVAAISGRVSVVGLLANAVAGPFVGPATVLGFAAAGLSLLSGWAAAIAGFGAAWSAQGILWTARLGARLPGAAWSWPVSPASLLLLAVAALGLAWTMPRLLGRPWAASLLALVMTLGFLRAPVQPGWPPPDWLMVSCDVGQGDGLVVNAGRRQGLVIDTGPDPAPMDRCLDQLGIESVPLLILSHYHADHVGGLTSVVRQRRVGEIWVSPLASPVAEARTVARLAHADRVPVRVPGVGESASLGSLHWQVIGPVGPPAAAAALAGEEESSVENDSSLVVMLVAHGVRILLTGDAEPAAQQALLRSGADLSADVLKLPHHGSARQDARFIAATHARVAIASAGLNNDYGHPAPRTVRLAESLGMTVLRTDLQGSVAIVRGSTGMTAVVQRQLTAAGR